MEYQATSKYVRVSTRKVRLVADSIRTMTPVKALVALALAPKAAAEPIAKTIASAVANAKQKNVNGDSLKFKTIEVMGGPAIKRYQAVSRGQAHTYKHRMTHIRVILTDAQAKKEGAK